MSQQQTRRLEFDDGQVVDVAGYGVVGRRPDAAKVADDIDGSSDAVLVSLTDEGKSVSRSHLVFGVLDEVFWVADAGSGNGTTLVYPDGNSYRLDPHQRYEVDAGSFVTFGGRNFRYVEVASEH